MSTPRFIADLHMGHRNIYKYRTVFESTLHNDLYWMYLLPEVLTKRDSTFFEGDVLFDEKYLPFIQELPGTKILIPGNHCTEYIPMSKLCEVFDEVHALLKYKEFWLSHAPIHKDELRGKSNVHGHVHTESVNDVEYLNISADSEFVRFMPRTLFEVREAMKTMQSTGKVYGGLHGEDAKAAILANPITRDAYNKALAESNRINVYFS